VKTSDITIVFQGAVKAYAQRDGVPFAQCVRRTRKALPNARVVLSTWEGTEIPAGAALDDVVFSPDPGPLAPLKLTDNKANNINRQIVSTLAGLRAVRTGHAVKLRTDCFLEHAGFLDFHARQARRDTQPRRIVTSAFFTLDLDMFERIPYHVSDWFQFAPSEVLQSYWNVPPMTQGAARHYEQHRHAVGSNVWEKRFRAEFAVEQYICMAYARGLGYRVPRYLNDTSEDVVRDYRRYLASETLVLDPWQIGVVFPKYTWVNNSVVQSLNNVMHLDWLALTGSPALEEDEPPELLQRALVRRRRQRALARRLAEISSPLHARVFEESARGRFLRLQAMRAYRFVQRLFMA
jgi:hypothetical protein